MADAPSLPTQPIRNKEAEPIQSGSFTVTNPLTRRTIYFRNPTTIEDARAFLETVKSQSSPTIEELTTIGDDSGNNSVVATPRQQKQDILTQATRK